MFQVCHIVLGLKPVSCQEENKIVRGWLQREERRGYLVGQFWCLIAIEWWHSWEKYVTCSAKVRCLSRKKENPTSSLIFPLCFHKNDNFPILTVIQIDFRVIRRVHP